MKAWLFPGQGAQKKGMGEALFNQFSGHVKQAEHILGYSLSQLCLHDPHNQLNQTSHTQPALFVVSTLAAMAREDKPDFVAGHSLGEYAALCIAGAFDFATGIKLVQKRGELMAKSRGGAMTAVVGWQLEKLQDFLRAQQASDVVIANHNTPTQFVLAGPQAQLQQVNHALAQQTVSVVPLTVSGAFHSPMMAAAQAEYGQFLQQFTFDSPQIPVISNVTAQPYQGADIQQLLIQQLTCPVRWVDSIHGLLERQVSEFIDVGPGKVLAGMQRKIERDLRAKPAKTQTTNKVSAAKALGCPVFQQRYEVDLSYYAGAMYKGIASKELVGAMARQRYLAFLGTGGQSLTQIAKDIDWLQQQSDIGNGFGVNLLCQMDAPEKELEQVQLYLHKGINKVEAAAFYEIRPSLVWFRPQRPPPIRRGGVVAPNQLIAKISRPELAQAFFEPAPQALVQQLLEQGKLTPQEAALASQIPLASDVCCEADSGGHTDRRSAMPVFSGIMAMRDQMMQQHGYQTPVALGLAGGLGTPDALAGAFMMGADFVTTGSINQCTVEAGTSDAVKDQLQQLGIQDTTYAPAGDMFELGVTIQVMKKGSLFASRGNLLWQLYQQYPGTEAIPAKDIEHLEQKVFRCPVDEVWRQTKAYYGANHPHLLAKAQTNPKYRMALIFKWYFVQSTRYARTGESSQKANYQVHTGPAMGAFNQWAKGTELEHWQNRHVATLAQTLMDRAAQQIQQRMQNFNRRTS